MDGLLGLDQEVIDLVADFVHLPHDGRGGIYNDLSAGWAVSGEPPLLNAHSFGRGDTMRFPRDGCLGIREGGGNH